MAMAVSSQQSRDAALLRATTELFVLDKTHDQAGIRRFEELAAHFLAKVSVADRAFVAERLARHPDTPGSILRMLGKDLVEIASPILRHAPALNPFDLLAIMAATGPAHWRMMASREGLAPAIAAALRMTGDAETIALLPAETSPMPELPAAAAGAPTVAETGPVTTSESEISDPPEILPELVAEATVAAPEPTESAPEPANHLAAPEISAPLSALVAARVLTASLSAEMSALASDAPPAPASARKPFEPQPRPAAVAPTPEATAAAPVAATSEATPPPAEVALPAVPAEAPAATMPEAALPVTDEAPPIVEPAVSDDPVAAFLRLDREGRLARIGSLPPAPLSKPKFSSIQIDQAFRAALSRARLPMLARQHQREQLIAALAEGLRLDIEQVTALLDDRSGEALIVLLKAIGLSDSEAQQVMLFANPLMREAVEAFFRLSELLAGIAQPGASRLVGEWRGDAEPEAAHQPHFANAPRRDTRPAALDQPILGEPALRTEKFA
ncbi:DUF2336 domain-containing protein [Kaistia sp. MMO-174]|uniref:DUF2336 domain-containing protein n=1 Tax=Kaistia sp. MMO-174 TaxID=3081256 RepID=UPI003019BD8A